MKNRRLDWSFRLNEEQKVSSNAHFLTLTYDDENIPLNKYGNEELRKKDFQLFMKKVREMNLKQFLKHSKWKTVQEARALVESLKYYTIGEYGPTTLRPHYHTILFNLRHESVDKLQDTWGKGNLDIGTVTPQSINYVTGYLITKSDFKHLSDRQQPFAVMSQGLGKSYLDNNTEYHLAKEV